MTYENSSKRSDLFLRQLCYKLREHEFVSIHRRFYDLEHDRDLFDVHLIPLILTYLPWSTVLVRISQLYKSTTLRPQSDRKLNQAKIMTPEFFQVSHYNEEDGTLLCKRLMTSMKTIPHPTKILRQVFYYWPNLTLNIQPSETNKKDNLFSSFKTRGQNGSAFFTDNYLVPISISDIPQYYQVWLGAPIVQDE
jgi:hypothetical protein